MSLLKQRLLAQHKEQQKSRSAAATATSSSANEPWGTLGASLRETEYGTFVHRIRRRHLSEQAALAALRRDARHLQAMLAHESGICVTAAHILFFDTETTGLGAGAGNMPFIIGCGYFEGDEWVVEQLLVRHPGEEPAMLAYFRELLRRFPVPASYNGKSFDWPVMKNRFVLNRLQGDEEPFHHLDLLYAARSLWKAVLPSCSLDMVEKHCLGVARENDVPGYMAPVLYFEYLASQNPTVLSGVLRHNEQDLTSLAMLASHFARLLKGEIPVWRLDAEALLHHALWLDKQGRRQLADSLYAELLRRQPDELHPVRLQLAAILKQKGKWREAVQLWRDETAYAGHPPIQACIELAKYYEHQEKNIPLACHYTEQAKSAALQKLGLSRGNQKFRALLKEIDHRLGRLQAKQAAFGTANRQ